MNFDALMVDSEMVRSESVYVISIDNQTVMKFRYCVSNP